MSNSAGVSYIRGPIEKATSHGSLQVMGACRRKQTSRGKILKKEHQNHQYFSNTISHTNVKSCNKNLWLKNDKMEAKKDLERGKIMGVNFDGMEDAMVVQLEGMVRRDQKEIENIEKVKIEEHKKVTLSLLEC
ncbi:hypothetical protein JHK87_039038 [Glycine soja]|nr:hypothetical protein JHK87_039038 [Glycine soja]